ncbi:MAG TPA: hypothetical protein VFS20_01955, partial [Longimicrobium sp.]|nr:hypothetical protein [Longimicrobium sp.]
AAPRQPAEPPAVRPVVPAAGIEQAVERVDDAHRPRTAVPPPSEPRTAAPAAPLPVDTDPPRRPASAPPAHPVEAAGEARDGGPVRVVVEAADDDELLMPRRAARPRAVAEEREDAVKEHAPGAALPAREADGGSVEAAGVAAPGAEDAEPDADSAGAQPRAAGRGSVVRPEAVRVAERPVSPTAAEPAAARPVVRVTIGRIEVRAAPPPAQPQPAAKPGWTPPVLSLGDYLKREAGR